MPATQPAAVCISPLRKQTYEGPFHRRQPVTHPADTRGNGDGIYQAPPDPARPHVASHASAVFKHEASGVARYAASCDQSNVEHRRTAVTALTSDRGPPCPAPSREETWSTSGLVQTTVHESPVWNVEPFPPTKSRMDWPAAGATHAQLPWAGRQRGVPPKVTEQWMLPEGPAVTLHSRFSAGCSAPGPVFQPVCFAIGKSGFTSHGECPGVRRTPAAMGVAKQSLPGHTGLVVTKQKRWAGRGRSGCVRFPPKSLSP